ncbi:MAG: HAD family acid phosphatase [Thermoprotei archaeon]|nr:HAD family acid phosphatase [Thermoprotei archaeon]
MLEPAVVFDIDGVLVDSSARFRACLEEAGLKSLEGVRGYRRMFFWRCFLSSKYLYLDKPRPEYVSLALDYARRGYKVVVVSGRGKAMEADTWAQLRDMGLDRVVSEVVLRRPGDYREERVYKVETLRRLMGKYRVEAVYDDSESVVKALSRELPKVKVFHVK